MTKNSNSVQTIAMRFVNSRAEKDFGPLMSRLTPGLKSFIYKYIQDKDSINEIVAKTFISIWEKIDQYNIEYNFSTWAYAIAKNEALGQIRINNRHVSHEKLTENHSKMLKQNTPLDYFQTEVIGPIGEELTQQLYDASINAIEELCEPYKTVMIEREVHGKQLHKIAEELGWPTSTVKTRLRKARAVIAETVKKSHPDLVNAYNEPDED